MSEILDRMRSDWDRRAREDARYYVAFGRREQEEAEFQRTAADVVRNLDWELRRLPRGTDKAALRALEIGCGVGRVMLPMSTRFGEIHGVDISEEMLRQARQRLAATPNAHVQATSGADLAAFEDDGFDFVYSYAVFQHIPSREVVFDYLRETRRVLKPGGLARFQLNGLAESAAGYDTWHGVRIGAAEIRDFARSNDFQLLALEGSGTQYMWVTLCKKPAGWHADLACFSPKGGGLQPAPGDSRPSPVRGAGRQACHAGGPADRVAGVGGQMPLQPVAPTAIRRISNVFSTEPLAPCRGRLASVSLWMEALPAECDLLHLEASIGGLPANPFYIGPEERDGLSQLNTALPAGIATGLQPVHLTWLGEPLCAPAILRVVPPGPTVPRVEALSDAVDLLSGTDIRSGIIKLVLEDVERISDFRASMDGQDLSSIETLCVDPTPMRYEVNVHLPPGLPKGDHSLEIRLGHRKLGNFGVRIL